LATGLRTEFPEVEWATRTSWNSKYLLSVGEKKTYERGIYAEPDFFNIFNFPVLAGNPVAALRESGSIVITQRTAEKFFGKDDPIGKTIRVENEKDLKVAAVLANIPANSTLRFDVIMPFGVIEQRNLPEINSNWANNSWPTWVSLHPKTDLVALNAKLENYIQGKNPDAAAHALAYPLSEFHLRGKFKEGKPDGGRIQIITLLGIVGLFVLLIACVNFMNLATAPFSRSRTRGGRTKGGWGS
jgi:putative ABC transport system permease protein